MHRSKNSKKIFSFLILGKAGVGKSSLVNNIISENVAHIGSFEQGTTQIKKYSRSLFNVSIKVYDTPGLYYCRDPLVNKPFC